MKKLIRIFGVIVVIGILGAAIIASMVKPSNADMVWDEKTTVGKLDAKNYFIIYSDIMCPYCVAFENAIFENEEAFDTYIEENDILVEVRLSDFLYQYGESRAINSRYSAVAAYCAKNEGKFWDYYKKAITTVWNDFFKKLGKSAFTELNTKDKGYWISLGEDLDLSDEFKACVLNDDPLDEIIVNAEKTAKLAKGMPFFKFNKFTSSGFSLSGNWSDVLMFFKAGLDS